MRLEQENDDLAHELVTSKIALRKDLDNVSVTDGRRQLPAVTLTSVLTAALSGSAAVLPCHLPSTCAHRACLFSQTLRGSRGLFACWFVCLWGGPY